MAKYMAYVSFWDKRKPIDENRPVITLAEYAKRNFITYKGAYRRLCSRDISGYKLFGRWYIYDDE